jgi:hypothetical protein
MHDNSLSNGYLIGHSSGTGNVSPKYGQKQNLYISNPPNMMKVKFPTTSYGNRSSTYHNTQNYNVNMQNI